ncbi:hypothetical protein OROHE_025192 [Orobanche hederae]
MVCRIWDVTAVIGCYLSIDFVVSDSKGNTMHCTARNNIAHNFVKLKEGHIYAIKNFVVQPNKDEYRIIKTDSFMLELDGTTRARKVSVKAEGFDRYANQLTDVASMEPTYNKYLIDVAGYVTNVGRSIQQKSGSRTLDFYLDNQSGQSIRVTLWGSLRDNIIEKKTNQLYMSSSSSTLIYDDSDIPAIQNLKAEMSTMELSRVDLPIDHTNNPSTFNCKVTIDGVRTTKGWNYPSCSDIRCKKGASRKGGHFWCDSCDKSVAYPVLRYRLELEVSDGTTHIVVVLFDESATELVGCSVGTIVETNDEVSADYPNLPKTIANLIGTTHVLELKSNSYYEHGTYESFTC